MVSEFIDRRSDGDLRAFRASAANNNFHLQENSHEKGQILIVEDHEGSRRLFADLLKSCGFNIIQTGDPLHAFELLKDIVPDLIIMDIRLPHVSGLELTRWIKEDEQLRSIPIVAVTAFAMLGDRQRILEGGCDAYISKPLDISSFLQTVHQILGRASGKA